jgi:hypothetical protein
MDLVVMLELDCDRHLLTQIVWEETVLVAGGHGVTVTQLQRRKL